RSACSLSTRVSMVCPSRPTSLAAGLPRTRITTSCPCDASMACASFARTSAKLIHFMTALRWSCDPSRRPPTRGRPWPAPRRSRRRATLRPVAPDWELVLEPGDEPWQRLAVPRLHGRQGGELPADRGDDVSGIVRPHGVEIALGPLPDHDTVVHGAQGGAP